MIPTEVGLVVQEQTKEETTNYKIIEIDADITEEEKQCIEHKLYEIFSKYFT